MYRTSMISKDLVAASSRPLVLAILAESESYGYAIILRVKELSGDQMQWTDGMLYPILHRLERQGLIQSEWRQGESGRRRKYYKIVPEGKKALTEEQRQWRVVQETLENIWRKPCHV